MEFLKILLLCATIFCSSLLIGVAIYGYKKEDEDDGE